MLEFYETEATLEQLQERVESLFLHLAKNLFNGEQIQFRGKSVNLKSPWPRVRVLDLFQSHLNIDLRLHQSCESLAQVCKSHAIASDATDSWDDLYFKLWLNLIEPKRTQNEPKIVRHQRRECEGSSYVSLA